MFPGNTGKDCKEACKKGVLTVGSALSGRDGSRQRCWQCYRDQEGVQSLGLCFQKLGRLADTQSRDHRTSDAGDAASLCSSRSPGTSFPSKG